jgi:hypothetical protein
LNKRVESLQAIMELLPKLGDLDRLKDQIEVLEEAREEIYQPHDIDQLITKLTDLGPKLDALRELTKCLEVWLGSLD